MTIKTEKGRLLDGIPFGGEMHFDFELRLPVMADSNRALDATEECFEKADESYESDAFYRSAVMASTITLGKIPPEELTAELLFNELTRDDYDVLFAARERLKAKRRGGNPGSPDSESPSSPSDDAGSVKSE
ncbi:hypothetical protein [Trabulsiella odontotermitis]|uniref:hypothetical protein n=1 Tax=Trabulsiella odontotermitis TaxID=379893 RepID=UPI0006769CD1|nr:hypothetical protein [Trabulsiella odontotermitis]KNC89706.1 hypothetical protein GM30_06815 [Trabulsiella odontotermitis]